MRWNVYIFKRKQHNLVFTKYSFFFSQTHSTSHCHNIDFYWEFLFHLFFVLMSNLIFYGNQWSITLLWNHTHECIFFLFCIHMLLLFSVWFYAYAMRRTWKWLFCSDMWLGFNLNKNTICMHTHYFLRVKNLFVERNKKMENIFFIQSYQINSCFFIFINLICFSPSNYTSNTYF